MVPWPRIALFALALPAYSCVLVTSSDDADASSSASSEEAEASAEDTSSAPSCADFTDETSCNQAPGDEPGCAWATGHVATIEGDSCNLVERGICLRGDYADTAAGCGSAAGCDEVDSPYTNPYYLDIEEGLLLVDFCGGSPPAEFTPCGDATVQGADPIACACACELWPAMMP